MPLTPPCWRAPVGPRRPASRPPCWISGWWRGSATSTSARRCGAPAYRPSAAPPRSRRAPGSRTNGRAPWCKESATCSRMRSRLAARRCAITGAPTASSDCSSTNSRSTTAKTSAARGAAAAASSSASCRPDARRSSARCASGEGSLELGHWSFPGRGAARSAAPLIRDRPNLRALNGPGSAAQQQELLHCAREKSKRRARESTTDFASLRRQRLVEPLVDHRRDLLVVLLLHHDVAVALDAEVGELDPGGLDAGLLQIFHGAVIV